MTSTELSEKTPEITMDVDHGNQVASLSHPNYQSKFYVYKPRDQTPFFKINLDKGVTPSELSGHYSTLQRGIDAVKVFLHNSKETFAVKSDRLDKERKERHASKPNPANS